MIGIVHAMEAVGVDHAYINAPPCKTGPPLQALPPYRIAVSELVDGVDAALELVVVQHHAVC